jgi:hypothetical protein
MCPQKSLSTIRTIPILTRKNVSLEGNWSSSLNESGIVWEGVLKLTLIPSGTIFLGEL